MPLVAFVDDELYKKIEKISTNKSYKEEYPEQEFIASCLRVGLSLKDLEKMTYIEAMKVLYSFLEKKPMNNTENVQKATQKDIDILFM